MFALYDKEVLLINARNNGRGGGLRVEPAMTEGRRSLIAGKILPVYQG